MNELILVVDDEPKIVKLAQDYLEQGGFRVVTAGDGEAALEAARRDRPDLVVLDLSLPRMDGLDVFRSLRTDSDVPVIMLTARVDEVDRLVGLELGADDYITKPFSPREMVSRVRAVIRRTETPSSLTREPIEVDDRLKIDFDRREIFVEGELVKLRPTEFRLLFHLVQNAGWVVPHDQLLAKVWGYEYRDETHYLRLYVNYLRKKLEADPSDPKYILTERGIGYRFVDYKRDRDRKADDS